MNNAAIEKTMENVKKKTEILNLSQQKEEGTIWCHTTKFFAKYLLAIEMKKTEILLNKPVCLRPSILELSEILMHEFWCGYVKPKHGQKANLCYMDTDSFIVYVETVYIYKDTAKDVETRFDTSNYELDRPSSKGTNEKTIGFMKDELDGKITTKFFGLKAKT